MKYADGGYIKPITNDVFPDVGDSFFWRVIDVKKAVVLELRQYRNGCRKSSLYGARGPFQANADNMRHYAAELFSSLSAQVRDIDNAVRWAGDYPPKKVGNA